MRARVNAMTGKNELITDSAQQMLEEAQAMYRLQQSNQAGVPYEVYLCDGDYVCIQRYEMQQQRINAMDNYSEALKNQRIKIDANVNYQGNVNHRIYW